MAISTCKYNKWIPFPTLYISKEANENMLLQPNNSEVRGLGYSYLPSHGFIHFFSTVVEELDYSAHID